MNKTNKTDWFKVNWKRSDEEIAREIGVPVRIATKMRNKVAAKRPQHLLWDKIRWKKVDWSKSTSVLSQELSVDYHYVREQRREFAPETLRRGRPPASKNRIPSPRG